MSLSSLAHAVAPALECGPAALPDCAKLDSTSANAANSLGFGTPRDGGVIFNSEAYWKLKDKNTPAASHELDVVVDRLMTPSPARSNRAAETADEIRKQAIDYIKANTPDSPERSAILQRLRTFKIDATSNLPELCDEKAVFRGYPNVAYSRQLNTLYVCTAATNVTKSQLVQSLVHEFGHIVSPCNTQSEIYKLDHDQLYQGPLVNCEARFFYDENDEPGAVDPVVNRFMLDRPNELIYNSPAEMPETVKKLIKCDIVKPIPQSASATSNIFAATKSCLINTLPKTLKNPVYKLAFAHDSSPAKARSLSLASHADICDEAFDEAFADRFGAGLFGHISNGYSAKELQSAFLGIAGFVCYERNHPKSMIEKYQAASTRLKAMMNDRSVADKLGCELPKDQSLCPLKFSEASSKAGASAPKKKTPAKAIK